MDLEVNGIVESRRCLCLVFIIPMHLSVFAACGKEGKEMVFLDLDQTTKESMAKSVRVYTL